VRHGHPSNSFASYKFTITNTLLCASFVVSMKSAPEMRWSSSMSSLILFSFNWRFVDRTATNAAFWISRSIRWSAYTTSECHRTLLAGLNTMYKVTTLCLRKKTFDYIFYNNYKCQITVIFGILSSRQTMGHQKMVSFPPQPSIASVLNLWNHNT